ncbi:MAG TPA: hypothetical protein VD704_04080 [Gaiellaceae bacterium]|nr:hypothetical protein [Gaiellaceae bacterium]
MKRRLAALLVAAGSLAGAAALWRRRSGKGAPHVDAYFADGSTTTFAEGTDEAAAVLPAARRILFQARG